MQGRIRGISRLKGSKMVNNHFAHGSLLSVQLDQNLVEVTKGCLDIFCSAYGVVVSEWKTNYWLLGLDDSLAWIPSLWNWVKLGMIVRYLGILFGTSLSIVGMWNYCLKQLYAKLLNWRYKDLLFVGNLTWFR